MLCFCWTYTLCDYTDFLETEQFATKFSNGDVKNIYDSRNRFARNTALAACLHRWAHWGGYSAVLQNNVIRCVVKLFVGHEIGFSDASRVSAIGGQCYSLSSVDLPTAGLFQVCSVQHYEKYFG